MVVHGVGVVVAISLAAASYGTVVYVDDDAPPAGDGGSWATSYRFLQDALSAASVPGSGVSEIRLAGGFYYPDRIEAAPDGTGDREATFQLIDGVSLLGGYAGLGAADPDARDTALHETVLSGDLAGDDVPGFVNIAENSYHVVTGSTVDQTAVMDGLTVAGGNANGTEDPICFGGSSHGAPCSGDGDCLPGGHCVSPYSLGAGIFVLNGRPSINDCRIVDNFAAFQGGGILLKAGSHAAITQCTFSGNRALDNGGAMYLGLSSPTITDCTFSSNSGGRYAGAVCNRDLSNAVFENCLFENNTAAESDETGGGAVVNASSSPTFTGCVFAGNWSVSGNGGAVYNKTGFNPALGPSHPVLDNCTLQANAADLRGGAIYNIEGSAATLTGCTILEGAAPYGRAVYNAAGTGVTLIDCQVGGSAGGRGVYNAEAGATVEAVGCTFTSYEYAIYNLGGIVSLESCTFLDTAVRSGGNGGTASLSMTDCTSTGAGRALYHDDGIAALTGCTMTGNTLGSYGSGGAIYAGGGGTNAPPVLTLTDCVLSGNSAPGSGGAMAIVNGTQATVMGCTFQGNSTESGEGPAVRVYNAALTMLDCALTDNTGGISASGDLALANCLIRGNTPGGGVHCSGGEVTVRRCRFIDNRRPDNGAGFSAVGGEPVVINSLFTGNRSLEERGGGLYFLDSAATLINCTVFGNTAVWSGAGVFVDHADAALTNCILWGNDDGGSIGQSDQISFAGYHNDLEINYSCIQGWSGSLGGVGNFGQNPLFVNVEPPDPTGDGGPTIKLWVQPGSPCIDAGDSSVASFLPPEDAVDIGGNPRFADDVCSEDVGNTDGEIPPVDMGAYEFQGISPSTLSGDLDGDCDVDVSDVLALLAAWGPCPEDPEPCPADFDVTGAVDVGDVLILLSWWGSTL